MNIKSNLIFVILFAVLDATIFRQDSFLIGVIKSIVLSGGITLIIIWVMNKLQK